MNEWKRIFELAKHADLIQWDTLPSGARTPDHKSVVKAQKFAELIVRECIDTISDCSVEYCTRPQIVSEIKEHFGVEE